jgi:hypothetical protein
MGPGIPCKVYPCLKMARVFRYVDDLFCEANENSTKYGLRGIIVYGLSFTLHLFSLLTLDSAVLTTPLSLYSAVSKTGRVRYESRQQIFRQSHRHL